jgi:hypothetical protein
MQYDDDDDDNDDMDVDEVNIYIYTVLLPPFLKEEKEKSSAIVGDRKFSGGSLDYKGDEYLPIELELHGPSHFFVHPLSCSFKAHTQDLDCSNLSFLVPPCYGVLPVNVLS